MVSPALLVGAAVAAAIVVGGGGKKKKKTIKLPKLPLEPQVITGITHDEPTCDDPSCVAVVSRFVNPLLPDGLYELRVVLNVEAASPAEAASTGDWPTHYDWSFDAVEIVESTLVVPLVINSVQRIDPGVPRGAELRTGLVKAMSGKRFTTTWEWSPL